MVIEARYLGESIHIGPIGIADRLLVPCVVDLLMTLGLHLFLGKTFVGRAMMGVAQDSLALRLMAIDPVRIKTLAFGLGIATPA